MEHCCQSAFALPRPGSDERNPGDDGMTPPESGDADSSSDTYGHRKLLASRKYVMDPANSGLDHLITPEERRQIAIARR